MKKPKIHYYIEIRYRANISQELKEQLKNKPLKEKTPYMVTDTDGEVPIYMHIRRKGFFLRFYTEIKCNPRLWDEERQRINSKTDQSEVDNGLLDEYKTEMQSIFRTADLTKKEVTKSYIIENFSFLRKREAYKKNRRPETFNEVWEKFIEDCRKTLKPNTVKNLKTFKQTLDQFSQERRFKLQFNSINKDFLDTFIEWRSEPKIINEKEVIIRNTQINKDITNMKWFMSWATDEKYNNNTHFKTKEWSAKKIRLKVPKINDNVFPLTEAERDKIYFMKLDSERLDKVRDIFCFQCFSGLRWSDIENLKKDDINDVWMKITTTKTTEPSETYLVPPAQDILKKYEQQGGDFALPKISGQKFNVYLKELGKKAGLDRKIKYINWSGRGENERKFEHYVEMWKKMSSHIGRKTYKTICDERGVAEYISGMSMGHSSSDIQERYRLASPEHKKSEQMKIWNPKMKVV